MKTTTLKELILGILILIPVVYLAMQWGNIPEIVPTHWGIDGKVNGFSSKNTLLGLVLGLPILVYLILRFAPKIDPKKENYAIFGETYYRLRLVLGIFMCFVIFAILYGSQHPENNFMSKWVLVGVSLLLAAIGNYLPTLKPNWFAGIRTPWTLSNEEVWRKTHQFAGKIWFWGGIVSAILGAILPETYAFYGFLGIVLGITLFPIYYSYRVFRKKAEGIEN